MEVYDVIRSAIEIYNMAIDRRGKAKKLLESANRDVYCEEEALVKALLVMNEGAVIFEGQRYRVEKGHGNQGAHEDFLVKEECLDLIIPSIKLQESETNNEEKER